LQSSRQIDGVPAARRRGSVGSSSGGALVDGRLGGSARRSTSVPRSGRPFRQSQHVVDVHSAVKVSAFRAFPQTVERILWTGLDTTGEHMFSSDPEARQMGSDDAAAASESSGANELPVEGQQRLLRQIFEFWVNPEIERRRNAGALPPGFALLSAQVILNIGEPTLVRLNEEVRAGMQVIPNTDVVKGSAVYWDQIKEIKDFQLTDDDPNAGHFTIFWNGKGWLIVFDCRYNAARVGELLKAADEFLAAATYAREHAHGRAFLENLFAAAELTAKARLVQSHDEAVLDSHKAIHSKINLYGRLGNVDREFVAILNQLGARRGKARYVEGAVGLGDGQMEAMLATVRAVLQTSKDRAPRRFSFPET
jgi:hypothetical protein